MTKIAEHDVECDGNDYLVTLFPGRAHVFVRKTQRDHGVYIQELKHGSTTFRRVLRALHQRSDAGSLTREHLAQCADTEAL